MTIDTSKLSLTTINGYLSAALAFGAALAPFYPRFAAAFLAITGALKIAIGTLQKDAGQEKAIPPGGGDAVMVPSHEVPDQLGAKVVK